MEYTIEERYRRIVDDCVESKEINPIKLFHKLAGKDYIRIHGPEHHILDGACIMTAYYNTCGNIDLRSGLEKLVTEGIRMPGATCGLWGVCGSVTSVGAALAIIEGTGPLSEDDSFGHHMGYTSNTLQRMSEIGGPRCCKRHAFIAISEGIGYLNKRFSLKIPNDDIKCGYFVRNAQCLKTKCPFYAGG